MDVQALQEQLGQPDLPPRQARGLQVHHQAPEAHLGLPAGRQEGHVPHHEAEGEGIEGGLTDAQRAPQEGLHPAGGLPADQPGDPEEADPGVETHEAGPGDQPGVAAQALAGQAIGREMREPFEQSVRWGLDRFGQGGFAALESFLDERVPKDKRKDVAQTYIKIVQGAVVEVDAVARERAGLPRRPVNEANYRFLIDSLVGVSALFDYGAPVFMQLDSFDEVKATGLQITRSPGKTIVYLGSVLLVLGIICMFYIRELRVWVLVKSDQVRVAMASNRKTSDLDRDFERHSNALQQLARGE